VFGEVIEGLDIIDSIAAQPTDRRTNRPVQDIQMTMKTSRIKWK
jgi:peptidyl-prolyl cis-trans isomerase B (cyclophilin B)